jgi:hypothetical protein
MQHTSTASNVLTLTVTPPHRQPHILLLLGTSFLLFTGSFVVDQAFRWTNPLEGILSGIVQVLVTGIAWLFYGLLPGLLMYGLYRWRGWSRFRTVAIIAPGIVACSFVLAGLILSPTTPARRLKRFTGADLPASARDLRTCFTGGGLADYGDTYYFRCSATDTNKLIEALHLSPESINGNTRMFHRNSPGWPDPSTWQGGSIYQGGSEETGWFYYLLTDSSREQVYLFVGCI